MAKKPETKFKERVQSDLAALPNTWCVKIQQVGIRGTPDILACISGTFVALELKSSEKCTPDALQEYNLRQIAESGGIGLVTSPANWADTFEALFELAHNGEFPEFH